MLISKLFTLSVILLLGISCAKDIDSEVTKEVDSIQDYIVVFKKDSEMLQALSSKSVSAQAVVKASADKLGFKYNAKAAKVFSRVIQAAVYRLDQAQYIKLSADPQVAYIEKDAIVSINSQQNSPVWGLDRIDQVERSGDDKYVYPESGGENVNAYVVDTGIRVSHEEFEGRAYHGYDAVDDDSDASDCNGHGTHVAGTIGGMQYGVAKKVNLHAVRVLDCRGSGTISGVIAGVEWVTQNHVKPAVANMSLGGGVSQALDDAVKESISEGITYVIAAGNSDKDACSSSPSRVAEAISVGASTDNDRRASFSNHGTCLDIFAPGEEIKSAWYHSDSSTDTIDGTSMASPHVAGAVALYLGQNPNADVPSIVAKIISSSLEGVLTDIEAGSPNRLLNISFLNETDDSGGDDGGGSGDEPADNVIVNGEVIEDIQGDRGEEIRYLVPVPENAKNLKIAISGGEGDADLYVKQSQEPTQSSFDCRPYRVGNLEDCSVEEPVAGNYHVMIRAYSSYSRLSLKVSYELEEEEREVVEAPCSSCDEYDGVFTEQAEVQYHPNNTYYYQSSSKTHRVWVKSNEVENIDVEIYKWESSRWVKKSSSTGSGSEEYLYYRGSRGYYLVRVESKKGSGAYKLWHVGK